MTPSLSQAIMALAAAMLGPSRGEWAAAMREEFEIALREGRPLSFAVGCLVAAGRAMLTSQDGWLALVAYALALGVMLPMAALQVGCAVLDFPYLYADRGGLPGALLLGRAHEGLIRGTYQAAVPPLALVLLLLLLGGGQMRIAWAMLDGDWARVRRIGTFLAAAAMTLPLFMGVLFLDATRARCWRSSCLRYRCWRAGTASNPP